MRRLVRVDEQTPIAIRVSENIKTIKTMPSCTKCVHVTERKDIPSGTVEYPGDSCTGRGENVCNID